MRFGPPLISQHSEKEWTGKKLWWPKGVLEKIEDEFTIHNLKDSLDCKFYGAEYLE